MSDQIIQELKRRDAREDIPQFSPGDTIAVHVRVVEGSKERIQIFKGTVISVSGRGTNMKFTVRKISSGVGVERVFPVSSPSVAKVEVERQGRVRRSKLYYLRDRVGKKARIREKEVVKSAEQKAEEKAAKEARREARKNTKKTKAPKAKAE